MCANKDYARRESYENEKKIKDENSFECISGRRRKTQIKGEGAKVVQVGVTTCREFDRNRRKMIKGRFS